MKNAKKTAIRRICIPAAVSAVLGVLLLRHPEDFGKGKAGKIWFIVSQVLFVLLFVAAACVHRKY